MAGQLSFKHKVLKSLYGMGFKNFAPTLLSELKRGSDDWIMLVQQLLQSNDYPARKLALQQLTAGHLIEKSSATQRQRLLALLLEFLAPSPHALSDEKKVVVKFIDQHLGLFPKDDDSFRSRIFALQREKDRQLSAAADALLPKLGINMDDRDLYRRT